MSIIGCVENLVLYVYETKRDRQMLKMVVLKIYSSMSVRNEVRQTDVNNWLC